MPQKEKRDSRSTATCEWCGKESAETRSGEVIPTCGCAEKHESLSEVFSTDCSSRMSTASWDKVPIKFRAAIDRACEDIGAGVGLWVRGSMGTGKTMALGLAGKKIIQERLIRVRYVNVVSMFRSMTADISRSDEVFNPYLYCDLLMLDDVGKEYLTDWKLETLYYLVDRRYEEQRPFWIATNITGEALAERAGEALTDRIYEVCRSISLTGKSMRKAPE